MDERRKTDVLQQVAMITLTITLLILSGLAFAVVFNKTESDDRMESLKAHYSKLIRESEQTCDMRNNRLMERFDTYTYTTDIRLRELERRVSSNDNNK